MTRRIRSILPFVLVVLLCGAAVAQVQVEAADPPLVKWSQSVWESARKGDESSLETLFRALPQDATDADYVSAFRQTLELHGASRKSADESVAESRTVAVADMRKNLEAAKLSEALRSAIQLQDLSGDLDEALRDPDVKAIVAATLEDLGKAEGEQDWLRSQELLFLLRTLYEDTHGFDAYHEYNQRLSQVNRRVSLMAQYSPRHLHELRVLEAQRSGDEAPGEFNPSSVVDWRERVDEIRASMLKGALKLAAEEHIETQGGEGWRLLIKGGLEALRILATTPGLQESFPELAELERVASWVSFLDAQIDGVEKAEDRELDGWKLSELVDRAIEENDKTIRLPIRVLYREFGDGAVYKFEELFDDPYSEIVWPSKLRRFRQATEGNFIGVGILIRHNEKREIVVVNPLEGTPAYFAGIKPNDLILKVDGESAVGWTLNDAVDRITGPKGDVVTLGVRREGAEELVEVPIVRDVIKLATVKGWSKEGLDKNGEPVWDWLIDPVTRVAYVRITQFTEDTHHDIQKAWQEMSEEGAPNGLIVDLRYNPGGLLTSAVDVSNLFIQEGLIVSGEDKYGQPAFPDQRATKGKHDLLGVPTAILINKGSASASEIVAGCLQAHGAAVIVGERSYGKGSVQTVHHITNKARMKLTTHYYRLPPGPGAEKGRLVHKRPGAEVWGVDPDIEVKMTMAQVRDSLQLRQDADIIPEDEAGQPDPDSPERKDINRLLAEGLDPQLQTALLILQARALGDLDLKAAHASR